MLNNILPRTKKQIQDYWNEVQRIKHLGALSGCQYLETIEFLKIKDILKTGDNVLEVGIGLGYVTQGLRENGYNISALDISQEALIRVKEYCEKTYLESDVLSLPSNYFDVIICHNVIQHIPTYILEPELFQIVRSLKSTGVFALEFISSKLSVDTGNVKFLEKNPTFDENIGNYCRTPEYLEVMINKCGGFCNLVYNYTGNISDTVFGCHIFHVTK